MTPHETQLSIVSALAQSLFEAGYTIEVNAKQTVSSTDELTAELGKSGTRDSVVVRGERTRFIGYAVFDWSETFAVVSVLHDSLIPYANQAASVAAALYDQIA